MIKISDYNERFHITPSTITIKHSFNEPLLINTPLNELVLGQDFNNTITFTADVKKITFSYPFNQDVIFPETTEEIIFGECFNQYLNFYPQSLKILTFGDNYNQSLNNLPKNLKSLTLGKNFTYQLNIPPSVHTLTFHPESFKTFKVPGFIKELSINYDGPLPPLPNLLKLRLLGEYNWELINLPDTLIFLELGDNFNKDIMPLEELPSLKTLILGNKFNREVNIPHSLELLKLGQWFNRDLDLRNYAIVNVVTSKHYRKQLFLFPKIRVFPNRCEDNKL